MNPMRKRRGLCLRSTATHNPSGCALASWRDTSRHHDKVPVAFHRGDADDEWQAILHVGVEDLRNANGAVCALFL
jgi:hypothetical protein